MPSRKAHLAWLTYVFVLILIGSMRLAQKILTDTGGFASRYAPVIVAIFLAMGVLGYLYQKPLLRKWFWQTILCLSVFTSVLGLALGIYFILMTEGQGKTALAITFLVLLMLPAQKQIWLYSYRSADLWTDKHTNTHTLL